MDSIGAPTGTTVNVRWPDTVDHPPLAANQFALQVAPSAQGGAAGLVLHVGFLTLPLLQEPQATPPTEPVEATVLPIVRLMIDPGSAMALSRMLVQGATQLMPQAAGDEDEEGSDG